MAPSITPSRDYRKRELSASNEIMEKITFLRQEAGEKKWTFSIGYTTALDWDLDNITGLKPPADLLEEAKKQNALAMALAKTEQKRMFLGRCSAADAHFTWADHNVVTPVKDQGACGSCWVFGTHAAFEASYAILNGVLINTSEQDTLDCSGAGSCGGGWWAYQYLIDTGVADEADYGYTAVKGGPAEQISKGLTRRLPGDTSIARAKSRQWRH